MSAQEESDKLSTVSTGASLGDYRPEGLVNGQELNKRRQASTASRGSIQDSKFLLRTKSRGSKDKVFNQNKILKEAEKDDPPVSRLKTVLLDLYPGWFINNIRSWEKFEVAFRTWLVVWVSIVIALIDPALHWLGNASYLVAIIVLIQPAGGLSISEALISTISILLGSVIGWLHSVIAAAIAKRIRKVQFDSEEDFVVYLVKNGLCEYNPDTIVRCVQRRLFSGDYLEAKSSIIFAIAMGFSILIFFLIRMQNPFRTQICVISTIMGIASCSYTALFPFFGGTVKLFNALFRPVGVALALIAVTSFFVFPTTSLYKFLNFTKKQMLILQKYSAEHIKMMTNINPSQEQFGDFTDLHNTMNSYRSLFLPIMIQSNFIDKEFYYMRLDPSDILHVNQILLKLGNAISGMEIFYMNIHECKQWIDYESSDMNHLERVISNIEKAQIADYERSKISEAYNKYFRELNDKSSGIRNVEDLDYIMDEIKKIFLNSFEIAHVLLKNCTDWLDLTNNFRLSRFWPGKSKKYLERIKEIGESIARDKEKLSSQTKDMLEIVKDLCHLKGKEDIFLHVAGQVSLFEYISKQYVETLGQLCDTIEKLDKEKPKPRLHFPFASFFDTVKRKKMTREPELEDEVIRKRNPDTIYYGTFTGKLFRKMLTSYHYVMNDSHIPLGIRAVIATILVNLMVFFPNSVSWWYGNRVIWVPVMASITVSSDSYDSVYQFIGKVVSTLVGSIIAGFAWYISTGNGDGNPYGLGAVTGVLFFFATYYRHFSIHTTPMPAVVPVVTIALILGTSWQDAKMPPVFSIGWGVHPAYARFVSVIVGCSVAFIVSVIPHVSTGPKKVRVSISNVLRDIGRIHCQTRDLLIHRYNNLDEQRVKKKEVKVISLIAKNFSNLMRTNMIIKRMKYEPNLAGKWPKKKYETLIGYEIQILKMYLLLMSSFDMIEDKDLWVERISDRLGWTNDNLTSDFFSVIYMCSASLSEGYSLPRVTPSQLSLKHLDLLTDLDLGDPFYGSDSIFFNGMKNTEDLEEGEDKTVDIEMILSRGGRCNMISLILIHLIYEKIDQMLVLIKSLVGEEYNFLDYKFKDDLEEVVKEF